MRLRRIIWKRSRGTYEARKDLWMRLPVKGSRNRVTFWSEIWEMRDADRMG